MEVTVKIRIEIDGDEIDIAKMDYRFRAAVHTAKTLAFYVGAFILISVTLSATISSLMRL